MTPRDQAVIDRSARQAIRSSLFKLDEWMDPTLVEHAMVHVKGVGRFRVRASTDDLYHLLPSREPTILQSVKALTEGDVFIDAGANIGFYTVAASTSVGATGRVIAVEMMPDTAAILEQHLELNRCRNVKVVRKALNDHSGRRVDATVPAGKFGQASIARRSAAETGMTRTTVATITFDELLGSEGGPIALIKLDLEGAELAALKGAFETLKRTRSLIFEALDDVSEVRKLLEQCGFCLRQLDGNNWLAER